MSRTMAIAGREMRAAFGSPLGFVIIAIFLVLTGFFFDLHVRDYAMMSLEAGRNPILAAQLNLHDGLVRPLYQTFAFFLLLVVPLLSMRLLAEEWRQGTAELLLTAPIRVSELVAGKYLGALGFLTVMLLLTLQYPLFLWIAGSPPPAGAFATAFLGTWLLGASVLAVGLLMSSLTESQVIAAVASLVTAVFFWVIGLMELAAGADFGRLFRALSLLENLQELSKGVIDTGNLVFFASFIAFSLFLTQRTIESRRWR